MVNFSHDKSFNGTCAPTIYILGCSATARRAFVVESRVWLALSLVSFIALIAATIYRFLRVSESFNTLRLVLVCYLAGCVPHIIYDILRGSREDFFGASPHLMGFLWWFGSVPPVTVFVVLSVTWASFASKNLLTRPPLTANPPLFWGIEIPFVICSFVLPILAGVNYWYYFICTRIVICTWAALLLILSAFSTYYGLQTIEKLKATGDSFNFKQQRRVLLFLALSSVVCGIALGFQAYFLDSIDNFYQIFIFVTALYRQAHLVSMLGGAAYVWHATRHIQKTASSSLRVTRQSSKRQSTHDTRPSSPENEGDLSTTSSGTEESDDSVGAEEKV